MPIPLCGTLTSRATHVVNSLAHSGSVRTDGAATLLSRETGGLSSPGISLAHPTLAEDLGSDHLPITIELAAKPL